jgi:hypothetical protein
LKCIETSIKAVIDSTTERKFKSINQRNANQHFESYDNDTMQLRNISDPAHYPGSSNEIKNQFEYMFENDDRRVELENIINNGTDLPADFMNLGFDPQQFHLNELEDYEVTQEELVSKSHSMKDLETTQGTFYCRYIGSYQEINSLILEVSKKKAEVLENVEKSTPTHDLTFGQLLKRFKASNVTKHDKVEVFMNLLHLKRENKISMKQLSPEEFSDILIATKN